MINNNNLPLRTTFMDSALQNAVLNPTLSPFENGLSMKAGTTSQSLQKAVLNPNTTLPLSSFFKNPYEQPGSNVYQPGSGVV